MSSPAPSPVATTIGVPRNNGSSGSRLVGLLDHFYAVHARHTRNRNEAEDDLALGVGPDPGERPVHRPAFTAGLLEDIEVPHQGYAVAIHVKDAAAQPADAGVAASVMAFAESQRHLIPAFRYRNRVGEVTPTLGRVDTHVRERVASTGGIRRADQGVAPQEIGVGLPLLSSGILPPRGPAGPNPDGPDFAAADGNQFDSAQDRRAPGRRKVQMKQPVPGR